MKKKIIYALGIILFLSLIVRGGYITALNLIKGEKKEEIPKNIIVNITPTPSKIDICKNYKKIDLPDNSVNSEEIQKIIGYKNNKVGLYVYSVDDFILKAVEAVNSNGGEWGYVLIPYNIEEYDSKKWNKLFDLFQTYKIIPIIQLWGETKDYNSMYDRINDSAEFLNSLNWPIKNRYISVFNEMNDKGFWQKGVDPEGYAKFLDYTIKKYKEENSDFFMLNGAFNSSARTGGNYLSTDKYMERMDAKVPGIFKKLDGWASHSYPHVNGYLGKPTDVGRDSIKAYEWELDILKNNYDIEKIPVFITETGWPHAEGESYNPNYYSDEIASKYLKQAFENIWLPDERVVAVTPFTIKYDPPFDHFSFIKKNGGEYKIFKSLRDIKKIAGRPPLNDLYNPLDEYCEKYVKQNAD